jgi:molecular chaperone DnaJ
LRQTCPHCGGQGEKIDKPCHGCRGHGRVERTRQLNIKIPPGVDTGARLKLSGEGEAGERGGPRGDLYLLIAVKPHDTFERRDSDLYCEMLVPYTVAALGGEIEVPTLEGTTRLSVPAGTPAGKVLEIKEQGLPSLRDPGRRGHQFVRIEIEVPRKLSQEEQKLLRELAKLRGDKAQLKKKKGFFGNLRESL